MNKKNRNKKGLSILFGVLAFALFTGSVLAFFSDSITGNASVTAGTFDIDGKYELYYNNSTTKIDGNTIENFNPGDYVVIKATITNDGSKSAWIRNSIKVDGDLFETVYGDDSNSVISVYEGVVTDFEGTQQAINSEGYYVSDANVINGSMEIETDADGVDKYTITYTLYFNRQAKNNAQGKELALDFTVQAIQYRNNNEQEPLELYWNTVEEFSLSSNS